MEKKLSDQAIFITGASRGIGVGIAKLLASQGASLALSYASSAKAAKEVLESLEGDNHLLLQMNVAEEESVTQAVKKVLSHFGKISSLINNAGITQDQLLLRLSPEAFDKVINTNLRGSFLCTKAVMRAMLKSKKGSIVNITSVIGHSGNAGQSNYSASKGGLEAFSKSVAKEVASRNIRINCVAPGYIDTEMTRHLPESQKEEILKYIPLKRMGQVVDVAHAVSFLVSEESSYITGQTLHVNGGMYM